MVPAGAPRRWAASRAATCADYVQRYAQPEHIAENGHSNGHQNGDADEDMSADGFLSSSDDDDTPVTGAADL